MKMGDLFPMNETGRYFFWSKETYRNLKMLIDGLFFLKKNGTTGLENSTRPLVFTSA